MTVTDTVPVAGTHDPNLLLQAEKVDKYRTVEPLPDGSRWGDSLRCVGFVTSSSSRRRR